MAGAGRSYNKTAKAKVTLAFVGLLYRPKSALNGIVDAAEFRSKTLDKWG
jgi:hypothetical protein